MRQIGQEAGVTAPVRNVLIRKIPGGGKVLPLPGMLIICLTK